MAENEKNKAASLSLADHWKRKTRPASEWHQQVERSIAELSSQRQKLRQQIATQTQERRAGNPGGEESLSLRLAHQMARAKVLGPDWQRGVTSLKQAGARVRALRRKLQGFLTEKRLVQERSARWIYWSFKAPYLAWQGRSIRKRLRQASHQRRVALKTLRVIRPAAIVPQTRARILQLTETLLINDERLKYSIQNLNKADQALTAEISKALRLAPQLRGLGERLVAMKQQIGPECGVSIPKPVAPLIPAIPAQARKPKMRMG